MPFIPESQLGAKQSNTVGRSKNFKPEPVSPFTLRPERTGVAGVAVGAAKGASSTIKGLGTIGQSILDQTAGRFVNLAQGKGFVPTKSDGSVSDIYRKGTEREQKASNFLAPQGTAEKVGFTGEQIAEFFIPAGAASKAEKTIDILSAGIKSPLARSVTKILGKSAVQGLTSGGVRAAQTGGDIKETAVAAGTAGLTRGIFATAGEVVRGVKLPERIYSTIFKNSKADMLADLKADGIANLQRTNPEKYKEFVASGVIHLKDGQPIINETVAEQALNRGLSGSLKSMANEVVTKSLQAEDDLMRIVKNTTETVDIPEKQYINVLKSIAEEYQDVGFGEISSQADDLATKLSSSGGKVDASTALQLRRFLDRMRVAGSYEKPVSKLSLTQSNFKTLADTLRSRVNKIPGVGEIMKDYSFYIDAMDELAREAARRGNNQVLGLIDSVFLTGAAASANPIPSAMIGVLRRYFTSPQGQTFLAQFLKNPNLGSIGSGILGASSGAVSSAESQK